MKKWRRLLSAIMLLCMVLSMLPMELLAASPEITYVLDTDGPDPGAEYLITSRTGDSVLVLDGSGTVGAVQSATVVGGNTIYDFDGAENCLWVYEEETQSIKHGSKYLSLSPFAYQDTPVSFIIEEKAAGQFCVFYKLGTSNYGYYLGVNTSTGKFVAGYNLLKWATGLRFFKKTGGEEAPKTYSVTFNGNGYTAGTLPQNEEGLKAGSTYTIPLPSDDFRMDVGDDTYLFWCWTEFADGSGEEYHVGDTLTIDRDITLYAHWYMQSKYTVSMITYLDDVPTDVEKIAGYDRQFYAVLEGGDGTYIPLTRRAEGTYSAKVVENGTYTIYAKTEAGEYEPVHGHNVVIRGQDGSTECLHYSVTYDANGGTWAEGEMPAVEYYHYGESVTATDKIPSKEGNRFLYWKDQNGGQFPASQLITSGIQEKTTLTAVWEKTITVTVNVVINHNAKTTGQDNNHTKHDVLFTLMREENGVNLPIAEKTLTGGTTNADNITTYQVVFEDMPQGIYHAASTKSNYEGSITNQGNADENQTITIELQYAPENFDLTFDVEVKTDTEAEKELMPKAVNVKVTYWGYNEKGVLGWHTITQQKGENAPTTITIDENGKGTGFYPVWQYWSGSQQAYEYRVEVTSFVLPDGSIVPASGDQVIYTANGSGLYQATVSVDQNGRVPDYPDGSDTELSGAYFDGQKQVGKPKVVVEITPFTVTFDAGDGTLNDIGKVIISNQYAYPDLLKYTPVPNQPGTVFEGWYVNGQPAENLAGQYLNGNVTYVAKYKSAYAVQGDIYADFTYDRDGQSIDVLERDRVQNVWVILQKNINGVYNDVDSQQVTISYGDELGTGHYVFDDLPNDGTQYRILVQQYNYAVSYDNDQDETFTPEEYPVTEAQQVDVFLTFEPEMYTQTVMVDTSLIAEAFRPQAVEMQIIYRDLGSQLTYQVISQHGNGGMMLNIQEKTGTGSSYENVWKWYNNGTLYEYQLQLTKLYGAGFGQDGTAYTEDMPFTVRYDLPSYYVSGAAEQDVLKATLVPKEYKVRFDMGEGVDDAVVQGMKEFLVDSQDGEEYAYIRTWGINSQITAYPYRPGWVFTGWSCENQDIQIHNGGIIYVGAELAEDITLVATWEKLDGTDYAVRHLELNTEKVLQRATTVENVREGEIVKAVDKVKAITGYTYVGASVNGVYQSKDANPQMAVTTDPTQNVMVIYYKPDGSDGYTDQVEDNLHLDKQAVLENDGTYTINIETFTKDSPITTRIQQNTPLDIVLVLDQSGSIQQNNVLDDLQDSVGNFITMIADHGRENEVDHRIAIVGFASDEYSGYTKPSYPTAGKDGAKWYNTGVFDSNGIFHAYSITGFNYEEYTGQISTEGTYYTYADGEYLLLTFHSEYRHLITESEARQEALNGATIYGYVGDDFVELTRNTSGLWLYGDKQLYSSEKFFTLHRNVWTHRKGIEARQIHGYMINGQYQAMDGHTGVYTRTETKDANPEQNIYTDALVPVTVGANGSGKVTPGLEAATERIGANGRTYVSYGMEMANRVLAANPAEEGRLRIVVVFTDGKPGDGSNFNETEANKAIEQSYIATHTHKATVYTIGLYGDDVVAEDSDQSYFMNGLSSNYPDAKSLDDVWSGFEYTAVQPMPNGQNPLVNAGGPYYVYVDGQYRELYNQSVHYGGVIYKTHWYYENDAKEKIDISVTDSGVHPAIVNSQINGYDVFRKFGTGYKATQNSGYYTVAENAQALKEHFANVVEQITTKITTEIVLHQDTIVRDIMGQGLVLTPGTVITAYRQAGKYDPNTNTITWTGVNEQLAQVVIPENPEATIYSEQVTNIEYENQDGTVVTRKNVPYIGVYNLDSTNPTDPDGDDYHPHTVDITGYDFDEWYLAEDNVDGYKMVVTITRVEARDDVPWGRTTTTNHAQSGLWLPKDASGNRELLLPFDQPTTLFVERAYVLDYGKEFELSGWYFDSEDGQYASAIHVDCDIESGMNWFDKTDPTRVNGENYGNLQYGNVEINQGKVTYTPVTTQWGGYDQFYVFGNTWRKTVLAQDANENGNLWNKVTVIPANNVYYEDSFVTEESDGENDFSGFTFTGAWETVYTNDDATGADQNQENPEHQEEDPYGDVHGWTDDLADDSGYSDGSAQKGGLGAKATFRFTGTGVDVYTRTNQDTGIIVAMLSRKDADAAPLTKSFAMDNLAKSGDYYQIPTVSFQDLPYGTYEVTLIATVASEAATGAKRYDYYLDGIRVYNPLGAVYNNAADVVKDAYGKELNPVFTEIRDIILTYDDFNHGIEDNGQMGAVFIDWIREGQESGSDQAGTGKPTYEVGKTFKTYGPKNEIYLSQGQAIVLKVDQENTYYVGMKSLTTDKTVQVNLSGLTLDNPTTISVAHTTDMYYEVTPVEGYIVIQNCSTDGALLALTKLRTTNMYATTANNGVLSVKPKEAVDAVDNVNLVLDTRLPEEPEVQQPDPIDPAVLENSLEESRLLAHSLFTNVRTWLQSEEGGNE